MGISPVSTSSRTVNRSSNSQVVPLTILGKGCYSVNGNLKIYHVSRARAVCAKRLNCEIDGFFSIWGYNVYRISSISYKLVTLGR